MTIWERHQSGLDEESDRKEDIEIHSVVRLKEYEPSEGVYIIEPDEEGARAAEMPPYRMYSTRTATLMRARMFLYIRTQKR